ncbi:MAG: polyphosphate polymerase domain-containing protein [Eubacteriales bacterium]|nr:polyphosphate polymerase domain-containing protein [Eubacteriales bacterium]
MAKYKGRSLRYELKYMINEAEYLWVRDRLAALMPTDNHADPTTREYHLRSLYFDDINNSAMWEKQDGVEFRDKYRIRTYKMGKGDIVLEKKSKLGMMTAKDSAPMTRNQYEDLVFGDYNFLMPSKEPLFEEFYGKIRTQLLKPVVIVDYDREPYIYPIGNVRITFDRNLHSGQFSTDILSGEVTSVPVFDAGALIMEVKYDDILPPQVRALLGGMTAQRMAISKYTLCRRYH